jgi:glycosyltransferase involved in cell wall biosynthesis
MRLLFFDLSLPHLLADDEFPAGGFAVQLNQWLHGLCELGVEAGVLTFKGANAHVGRPLPFRLIETIDPNAGIRALKYLYDYIPALSDAAREFRPDAIVQSCASVYTGIFAHIAHRLRVPFVYRAASDSDIDGRMEIRLRWYERAAYRHGLGAADLVIGQNDYQLRAIRKRLPKKRVLRIYNSIQVPPDAPAPRTRIEREYVAWAGVFRSEKNLPLLLNVARALPELAFCVAGMPDSGADDAALAARDALAALPNVRLPGYLRRDQMREFFARATALLCTSHFEGFPNTFLEAFAAGTPVLTHTGVDPDGVVGKNRLGLVADSESQLTANVSRLANMRNDDYDLLAQKCRSYVETHHRPETAMRQLIDALETVTAA